MQKMTRDEIVLDFYLIYELSHPGVYSEISSCLRLDLPEFSSLDWSGLVGGGQ